MFAKNLKELLHRKGEKPVHLSAAIKVSAATISRWLDGSISPGLESKDKIADHFGVTVAELDSPDLFGPKEINREKSLFDIYAMCPKLTDTQLAAVKKIIADLVAYAETEERADDKKK